MGSSASTARKQQSSGRQFGGAKVGDIGTTIKNGSVTGGESQQSHPFPRLPMEHGPRDSSSRALCHSLSNQRFLLDQVCLESASRNHVAS